MRGKVNGVFQHGNAVGITPAHAGKSVHFSSSFTPTQDHPRTCGEKKEKKDNTADAVGSPPHMRGKVPASEMLLYLARITPAHAGKRSRSHQAGLLFWDHPRTCGEKL